MGVILSHSLVKIGTGALVEKYLLNEKDPAYPDRTAREYKEIEPCKALALKLSRQLLMVW